MVACTRCERETKYECIRCERNICNVCSVPETDETIPGWLPGKAVGYCSICRYEPDIINDHSDNGSDDEEIRDDLFPNEDDEGMHPAAKRYSNYS